MVPHGFNAQLLACQMLDRTGPNWHIVNFSGRTCLERGFERATGRHVDTVLQKGFGHAVPPDCDVSARSGSACVPAKSRSNTRKRREPDRSSSLNCQLFKEKLNWLALPSRRSQFCKAKLHSANMWEEARGGLQNSLEEFDISECRARKIFGCLSGITNRKSPIEGLRAATLPDRQNHVSDKGQSVVANHPIFCICRDLS
ncbi:hypothetical protein GGD54_005648 [Rhizobium tropici]|uniref:Uncharacterized protein n=2 Tax=Rhizobium TaxID=379 RepID=A0ABR6R7N7_RHITR|nr:hypothetical protein [Rhizobium tropici]MBB5596252.1 hypothetical protein [Rhizobium tropici]MBB6495171.1 hypothetical protein [Rhizobium tropici]SCB49493.1 hypothetical protein GA0061101_13060 [Rhizobium lusitanum]